MNLDQFSQMVQKIGGAQALERIADDLVKLADDVGKQVDKKKGTTVADMLGMRSLENFIYGNSDATSPQEEQVCFFCLYLSLLSTSSSLSEFSSISPILSLIVPILC